MSSSSSSDDTLTVSLTLTASPSSPRVPVVINKTASPSELRLKAAEATKIPLSSLKLIFRGRLIANDDSSQVVSEYKLEDDCVVHCMGKPAVTEESSSASETTAAPAVSSGSIPTFLPPAAASVPAPGVAAGGDPLQAALNALRSSNTPSVYLTAVTTLEKILSNCVEKPLEEKYRSVKKQNAAFQRRLGGLQGGDAAMLASGFVTEGQGDEESYVLHASPEAWPKLLATKAKVSAAVVEAKSAAGTTSAPPPAAARGFGGATIPPVGMPGGMGAGMPAMGAGGVPPNMQNAMSSLMSDPNQLQSMLQNPMVRNMLLNDPRFANPQMRQSLDMLSSNPQMLNQVSSMMRDPAMQAQMQSMMNSQGMNVPGGMNMPDTVPTAPANTNAQNATVTQPQNSNSTEQTDQEMTEEEMIQEAIQRSLRES